MSGSAHRGDDDIAFFAAAIEETRLIAASPASASFPDADGALVPGRYLIQILGASASSVVVWIQMGKFEKGVPLTASVGPGLKRVPLSPSGIIAIEVNVVKEDNDRIAVVTAGGTASVYITRISRGA